MFVGRGLTSLFQAVSGERCWVLLPLEAQEATKGGTDGAHARAACWLHSKKSTLSGTGLSQHGFHIDIDSVVEST